jgi:hypothetical protein
MLITRDGDFDRVAPFLKGLRYVDPWPLARGGAWRAVTGSRQLADRRPRPTLNVSIAANVFNQNRGTPQTRPKDTSPVLPT